MCQLCFSFVHVKVEGQDMFLEWAKASGRAFPLFAKIFILGTRCELFFTSNRSKAPAPDPKIIKSNYLQNLV